MTATVCSTAGEVITTPASQELTIPSDCTAVYLLWCYWEGSSGNGLSSATIESVSPDQTSEVADTYYENAAGVAVWYNPSTGANQTIEISWDITPAEGPVAFVFYVKDGDTSAWQDADQDSITASDNATVTLTTNTDDMILFMDEAYSGPPPSTQSGYTSAGTQTNASQSARWQYDDNGVGSSVTLNSDIDFYASVVGVAVAAAAAAGVAKGPLGILLPPFQAVERAGSW